MCFSWSGISLCNFENKNCKMCNLKQDCRSLSKKLPFIVTISIFISLFIYLFNKRLSTSGALSPRPRSDEDRGRAEVSAWQSPPVTIIIIMQGSLQPGPAAHYSAHTSPAASISRRQPRGCRAITVRKVPSHPVSRRGDGDGEDQAEHFSCGMVSAAGQPGPGPGQSGPTMAAQYKSVCFC